MIRYLIALLVTLAACFAVQTIALRAVGGRTVKSESNYFSSIARIQTGASEPAEIQLLGSSLTGRLPDQNGIGNLGCDGGSAIVTLRAIDENFLPRAPIIVIEANTLAYELEKRGSQIGSAIRSDWFHVGQKFPNVGANARPAAFAYSWLMERKGNAVAPATTAAENFPGSFAPLIETLPKLSDQEHALVADISALIERIEAKGSRVYLVMLPANQSESPQEIAIAKAVAIQTSAPWLDLNEGLEKSSVNYTDDRHLDPASARKVLTTILSKIQSQ